MPAASEKLRGVKNFISLISYLRTELHWPIETDNWEDLTFEYDAEELGLQKEYAHVISKLWQLRPLDSRQPWGIFFVEFKKKQLPIVVLRRILRGLVIKKRTSAKAVEKPSWAADDLLFISALGDEKERELTFAHFKSSEADLPTLRVLGWDGGDTFRKLDFLDQTLHQHLSWPEDTSKPKEWLENWSKPFRHRPRHTIRTAKELAEALADLAIRIRDAAKTVMKAESEKGKFRTLHRAFKESLIHDLEPDDFADTYAQTITYGLLTAAISRTDMSAGSKGTAVIVENVADMVPITSPFLKEILQEFLLAGGRKGKLDFDELGVQDVAELLRGDDTDLPAVIRDFGNQTRGEDPVIHFYEHFLSSYNKKLKVDRGVFYTPQSVVSYIVRSVNELLQTEFGLDDGLADTTTWGEMVKKHPGLKLPSLTDEPGEKRTVSPHEPFVKILDPATGTATYVVEVIDLIHQTLIFKWSEQGLSKKQQLNAWNEYVPRNLLPRLYAYELMMAPYAIAHMRISLKLAETGYLFKNEDRINVYLTNALEPQKEKHLQNTSHALRNETLEVDKIKKNTRFTIILGNPPWAGISVNSNKWIQGLMEVYKTTVRKEERQIQRLSNDYVKFFCMSENIIKHSKVGILALVTDNGYLDGTLFKDMRSSLNQTFNKIWILNLNGVALRGSDEEMKNDENVFCGITQGVAISVLAKNNVTKKPGRFFYKSIRGCLSYKQKELTKELKKEEEYDSLKIQPPKYLFVPTSSDAEYESWSLFSEIIGTGQTKADRDVLYGTGIKTRHDNFVIGWDASDAVAKIKRIAHRQESDQELIDLYSLCTTQHFSISKARLRAENKNLKKAVEEVYYRPFDWRSFVYLREFICEPKTATMKAMRNPNNMAMAVLRRNRKKCSNGYFVARGLIAKDMVSNLDDAIIWPLYKTNGQPSISSKIIKKISLRLKISFVASGRGDLVKTFGPEDIFNYIYAVLFSDSFRTRFAIFINVDFPRIPFASKLCLFRTLALFGRELVSSHLLEKEHSVLYKHKLLGGGNNIISKSFPQFANRIIYINESQGFHGISSEIWNFQIGTYRVCEKWLKDRRGFKLSGGVLSQYQKIISAISFTKKTIRNMDKEIERNGGWSSIENENKTETKI